MRKKTIIAVILVCVLLVTGLLVSCNDKCTEHIDENGDNKCDVCGEDMQNDVPTNNPGGMVNYTVNVKTVAGLGLKDVVVYIRDVNTNMIAEYLTTNENGTDTKAVTPGNYYAEVSKSTVSSGYVVEDKYYFNADHVANISLNTQVVAGAHSDYKVGSVMKDFTVNTIDKGVLGTFQLSEALKTHDAVLLNFFYTTCSPCITEFPYLSQAAGMYEDIAVIAVDTNNETLNDVDVFKSAQEIENIEMGVHTVDLFAAFNSSGYPTSVMIDKYGVICLIEVGGMPYLYPWTQLFDYFSADNYQQKLFSSIEELTPQEKPNKTQPSSDEVANVMSGNGLGDVTYYPETEAEDAEYYWPFILSEKAGAQCMATSNPFKYSSVCAMHVDVPLQQNQALSLDYICSTEQGGDYFYVLVNGEVIYTISGADEVPTWKKLYPYVATQDGTYKVSFVYNKDLDTDGGEDTVYIKNLSVVNASDINVATYIPRNAVSTPNKYNTEYQNYANVVFNEEDGYYHVGKKDGPLLLANLMNYVLDDVSEGRTSIYLYALEKGFEIDSVDYYPSFVNYCSYSSNSEIGGYCTVNEELKGMLEKMTAYYPGGVRDRTENGWLRFCKYYDSYGTEKELDDPIAGLSPFSAYDIIVNDEVGMEVYPNAVSYKTIIMPRGKLFSFTPEESGVYRVLSTGTAEVDGWIFDEESFYSKNCLYEEDAYERFVDTNNDGVYAQMEYGLNNVCMVYYFEAGKEYFINVAYADNTAVGTINFKIEYLGATYTMFRYASPAPFTFYIDPETGMPPVDDMGQEEYITIAGGVTPVLGEVEEDGKRYYYVGKSKIYVDFTLPIITGFMTRSVLGYWNNVERCATPFDSNGDNACDICGESLCPHTEDANEDGNCDACKLKLCTHVDKDSSGRCDDCGRVICTHVDEDDDLTCDDCGRSTCLHVDEDDDEACDVCGQSHEKEYVGLYVKGLLELGAFNFAEDEDGNAVIGGVDYSDTIQWYADNAMVVPEDENDFEGFLASGCVPVDEDLAEILQKLVDKYSFKGIKNAWTKLCYYYEYMGAEENEQDTQSLIKITIRALCSAPLTQEKI